MTMPHLENCRHDENGWCLNCVKKLHDTNETEIIALRNALKSARLGAKLRGITTREFAAMCAITPTQLSHWTADNIQQPPDLS